MGTLEALALISVEEWLSQPGDCITVVGPVQGSLVTISLTELGSYEVMIELDGRSWSIPASSLGAALGLVRAVVIGAAIAGAEAPEEEEPVADIPYAEDTSG